MAAYIACNTQWQYAGMGARCGLRYEGCTAVLGAYLPGWQQDPAFEGLALPDLLRGLQLIESATLQADAERRTKPAAPAGDPDKQRIGGA